VEIAFVNSAKEAFPKGHGAPDPSNFYTTDTVKVKCNEALREDFCRYFSTRERNCEGDYFAERYAYSYLFKCLKDLYQGEIIITGEPSMKPYDQVFLFDTYNDMAGAVEVEQVTHIFSQETGFVTVIVPDLAGLKKIAPYPQIWPIFHAFLFYNLPSSLSFFGRNPEVLKIEKDLAINRVPISLKFFFRQGLDRPGGRGFVTVITKQGGLLGKRQPEKSLLPANPGLFSTLFNFVTSRHRYLFWKKPGGFEAL